MDIKKAQFRIEHLSECSAVLTNNNEFGTANISRIFESAKRKAEDFFFRLNITDGR